MSDLFAPPPRPPVLRGQIAHRTRELRELALLAWLAGFRRRFGREPTIDDRILMRAVVAERIQATEADLEGRVVAWLR